MKADQFTIRDIHGRTLTERHEYDTAPLPGGYTTPEQSRSREETARIIGEEWRKKRLTEALRAYQMTDHMEQRKASEIIKNMGF